MNEHHCMYCTHSVCILFLFPFLNFDNLVLNSQFLFPLSPLSGLFLNPQFPRLLLFSLSLSFSLLLQNRYNQAKLSIHDRNLKVAAVVESLEREMELLCLTGVEDQLQADVRPTLELLRNAGIKVSKEIKTSQQ